MGRKWVIKLYDTLADVHWHAITFLFPQLTTYNVARTIGEKKVGLIAFFALKIAIFTLIPMSKCLLMSEASVCFNLQIFAGIASLLCLKQQRLELDKFSSKNLPHTLSIIC